MPEIDPKNLVSTKGFFEAFFTLLQYGYKNEQAFDYLNDLYYDTFGIYKFSDYNSFKATKSYHDHKKLNTLTK